MRDPTRAAMPGRKMLLGACAALALPTTLLAGISDAQARSVRPWQKYRVADCSGPGTTCSTQVYKVPKNKRLEITNVSCLLAVNGSGPPIYVRMRNEKKAGGSDYDNYVPVVTNDNLVAEYSAVNNSTRFIARAGDILSIQTGADTDIQSLSCKFAGDLTTF